MTNDYSSQLLDRRVKILSSYKTAYKHIIGCTGTITRVSDSAASNVGVALDNLYNDASATGVYWFSRSEIEFLYTLEEDNNMGKTQNTRKALKGYTAVISAHEVLPDRSYVAPQHFALYSDASQCTVGDRVVVTLSDKTLDVYTVVEVVTVEDYERLVGKELYEEVVDIVAMHDYNRRVSDRRAAAELLVKMDAEIKKMDEARKYELYAANNPELAAMLAEYNKLANNN